MWMVSKTVTVTNAGTDAAGVVIVNGACWLFDVSQHRQFFLVMRRAIEWAERVECVGIVIA